MISQIGAIFQIGASIEILQNEKLILIMNVGPVELLIIQGSPFCNIDCRYCYLPDRLNKARVSAKTIQRAIKNLINDDLLGRKISIVWHAGEPFVHTN